MANYYEKRVLELEQVVARLEIENKSLRESLSRQMVRSTESSWATNPDRSGGAFTEEEEQRAKDWR